MADSRREIGNLKRSIHHENDCPKRRNSSPAALTIIRTQEHSQTELSDIRGSQITQKCLSLDDHSEKHEDPTVEKLGNVLSAFQGSVVPNKHHYYRLDKNLLKIYQGNSRESCASSVDTKYQNVYKYTIDCSEKSKDNQFLLSCFDKSKNKQIKLEQIDETLETFVVAMRSTKISTKFICQLINLHKSKDITSQNGNVHMNKYLTFKKPESGPNFKSETLDKIELINYFVRLEQVYIKFANSTNEFQRLCQSDQIELLKRNSLLFVKVKHV